MPAIVLRRSKEGSDMFRDLCDEFILVGHVKDTVTEKDGALKFCKRTRLGW